MGMGGDKRGYGEGIGGKGMKGEKGKRILKQSV